MIIIVGLGPGTLTELPLGTYNLLSGSIKKYFRTRQHPVVNELAELGITYATFDHLYEEEQSFDMVYKRIAEIICQEEEVIYGVPGHPMVAEESVLNIIKTAKEMGKEYKIIPAISFIDYVFTTLEIDPSKGLNIIDGMQIEVQRPTFSRGSIITQIYNGQVASDVKLTLMERYPDDYEVVLLQNLGIKGLEKISYLPLYKLDRTKNLNHLTSLYLPPLKGAIESNFFPMDPLVEVMARLRGEGGCPWDKEQDHRSLAKYLLEETYEVLEAIEEEDMNKLQEELGDLLLQIVFHSQIALENEYFNINDVIMDIKEKLIRRHPHVFGDITVENSGQVISNWEEIKKVEKVAKGIDTKSALSGITKTLPALLKAEKIQKKAAQVGFDWPDFRGALAKIEEELTEFREAIHSHNHEEVKAELGDLLFAVVNLARFFKVNPEEALNYTINKFIRRFQFIEEEMNNKNRDITKVSLEELDYYWDLAKSVEKEQNRKK